MNTPPITSSDLAQVTASTNSPATPQAQVEYKEEQTPPAPSPDVQLNLRSNAQPVESTDAGNIDNAQQAQQVADNVVNLIQSNPEQALLAQGERVDNAKAEAALKVAS